MRLFCRLGDLGRRQGLGLSTSLGRHARLVSVILSAAALALTPTSTIGTTPPVRVVVAAVRVVVVATLMRFSVAPGLALCELPGLVLGQTRNRSWNGIRGLVDIEFLVDRLRNRLDLCAELLLNLVEIETVIPVDEVDRQTQMSKTSGSANSVQVGLSVLWEVEVDDHVNRLDIDTSGEQVRADKVSTDSIPEIVENTVTVVLEHARM